MQSKEHRYSKIHNLGTHTFNKGKSQCFLEFLNSQTRRENMLLVPITESQFLGLKQCYSQGSFFDDTLDHGKSKRVPEKHRFLLYWLCQSLWLCGSQETVDNSERDGNTRPPNLPFEKSVCRSGSNSWNWTGNNRLVPNRKRSASRLYIVTLLT